MEDFRLGSNSKNSSRLEDSNQGIPKEIIEKINKEIAIKFPNPCKLGSCHSIWAFKKTRLKEEGYEWNTPAELNPDTLFD